MADPSSPSRGPAPTGWNVAGFLLAHRWRVVAGAGLAAAVAVGLPLISGRQYTARASFSPQAQDNGLGAYAGVAAQLGVQLPLKSVGQPPEFYVYMIRSDAILHLMAQRRFVRVAGATDSVTLAELFGETAPDSARREYGILRELRRMVLIRYDPRAQLVQLEVRSRWPGVSFGLAEGLLAEVDRFNREVLRTQAGEERRFSASRVAEVERDLKAAEDALTSFLLRNRDTRNSPTLLAEERRLEREIQAAQTLYLSLRQSYEQARLQEVRNTPVISLIEAPTYPSIPDRRRLLSRGVLGLLVGGGLSLLLALLGRSLARAKAEDPAAAAEVGGQLRALGRELRSPRELWRALRSGPGGGGTPR